ncbi:methyltransferase domain-containing protein [Phthorimaea operculella]|nr:methyltransferase domain-containing protein [Phthorimaea operculella]
MSLPSFYITPEDYFEDSMRFFNKYQYLFKIPNTHILLHGILDKIDVANLENVFDEAFDLAAAREKTDFLKNIFEELDRFEINYERSSEDDLLDSSVNVAVGQKKRHEIVNLTKQIKEICDETSCSVVVDFGSGLGYLDQLLYETSNLKVLGIECNENHYVGAKKRQNQYHKNSLQNVKYIKHTINENSDRNIQQYVIDKFGKSTFCITGLHACADLTIDGINLFLKMADARGLILMPCCYHKMAPDDSKAGRFKNFPLSRCLRTIFERSEDCSDYMGVPFLRLAAQPPTWHENLEQLVFNLLARATLQLYAYKHNYRIKRNKRKAVKTKTVHKSFSEYIRNANTGFTLVEGADEFTEAQFNIPELQSLFL